MTVNYKYQIGEKLGPLKIELVDRVYKTNSSGNKICYGVFKCPYHADDNDVLFESIIYDVICGNRTNCGCQRSKRASESRRENLIGKKFGHLTVVALDEERTEYKNHKTYWLCKCDCGNPELVSRKSSSLKDSTRISKCDRCRSDESKTISKQHCYKNLIGQTFGDLTVIQDSGQRTAVRSVIWLCKCSCGSDAQIFKSTTDLLHPQTTRTALNCGCKKKKSKGEDKISKILNELNIKFEREKTFDDCLNNYTGAKLRFDFYLTDYNICIEYDGIMHYTTAGGWSNEESLSDTRYRDSIKDKYCSLPNNPRLIRIPYTDFDILDKQYIFELISSSIDK